LMLSRALPSLVVAVRFKNNNEGYFNVGLLNVL